MIEAVYHDTGTRPLVITEVPGMDRLRWRELDMEESVPEDIARSRIRDINEGIKDAGYIELRPWPGIVPRHAPVDRVASHVGFDVRLQQRNSATLAWDEVPEGQVRYTGLDRALDRNQWRAAQMLTADEVQALEANVPTEWVRLPYDNEPKLGPALASSWYGLQAPRFALSMPDNDLWTPFDLTAGERYEWIDDEGQYVERGHVYAQFGDRSRLTVYLRPRRWRYVAQVLAHYYYITPFQWTPNDEWFIKVWFDRPPFYPVRHELPQSLGNQAIWHPYFGSYLDYDPGIDKKFDLSRAYQALRHEIAQQQYYSKLVAYVLVGVEPAQVTIQRTVPRRGEIVCGVGIRDQAGGTESRVWAIQFADVSSEYPFQTIGQFWADFRM